MSGKGAATPPPPTEAQMRELAMHAETLRDQLATLEGQREYVAELTAEARRSLLTLEHVQGAKSGDEILMPLGGGAFVRARLDAPEKVISSLGSGIHAEVPTPDAAARLRARVESLESASQALAKDLARLNDEMARVNALVEQVYGG